jgi:hypothetical protein
MQATCRILKTSMPLPFLEPGSRTIYTTKRVALPHYQALREKYLQRAQGRERELLERTFTTLIERIERMPDDVVLRISVEVRPQTESGQPPQEALTAGAAGENVAQPTGSWTIAVNVRAYSDQVG